MHSALTLLDARNHLLTLDHLIRWLRWISLSGCVVPQVVALWVSPWLLRCFIALRECFKPLNEPRCHSNCRNWLEFTTQIQGLPALLLIRRKPSAALPYPLVWRAIQWWDPPLHWQRVSGWRGNAHELLPMEWKNVRNVVSRLCKRRKSPGVQFGRCSAKRCSSGRLGQERAVWQEAKCREDTRLAIHATSLHDLNGFRG